MRKRAICLLLAGMMALTAAGCGERGRDGGTASHLNYGAYIYGTSLEPARSYDSWELVRYGVGECLVRFAEDLSPQPWLAERWELAEDRLTWTFWIREGVRFSDGSDCTAADVAASLERLFTRSAAMAPAERAEVRSYFTCASIAADREANTVTIVTETPTPDLPGCLAYPWSAVVSVRAEEAGADMAVAPVATGPYRVVSFDPAVGCKLEANPYYWDGTPGYETIDMQVIPDSTTRSMALQSGDIDVASYITYADIGTFRDDPACYEVHELASARSAYLYMNFDPSRETSEAAIRQAILLCTDNVTMCDVTVGGSYVYGPGIVPAALGYGNETLRDPFAYDAERAAAVLDAAGIVDGDGDGWREWRGEKIDIDLQAYENRSMDVFADAIKTQCAAVGIDVTVSLTTSNDIAASQRLGTYDMVCYNTLVANTGDPAKFLAYWYSPAEANASGYRNAEYDRIYAALSAEFDPDLRREYIRQLQQILIDDAAVFNCGYYMSNTCNSTRVAGVKQVLSDFYWITKDVRPAA